MLKNSLEWGFILTAAVIAYPLALIGIGPDGLLGPWSAGAVAVYCIIIAHMTITAMSLGFHRQHTHKGVKIHPWIDTAMQLWLWCFTSMCKRDWVSVHVYHHAHSDQPEDPHSPVQKGLARIFFFGVFDYTRAKSIPEVVKIRKHIKINKFELFLERNLFMGPMLLVGLNLILFGPTLGYVMSALNFMISPLFAVGGVNALAHHFGYRNYETTDNSRNCGFLVPLNWIVCGELDHNNHHAIPNSCNFMHRWYEFDIGYVYLRLLSAVGLAEIKTDAPQIQGSKTATAYARVRTDSSR